MAMSNDSFDLKLGAYAEACAACKRAEGEKERLRGEIVRELHARHASRYDGAHSVTLTEYTRRTVSVTDLEKAYPEVCAEVARLSPQSKLTVLY